MAAVEPVAWGVDRLRLAGPTFLESIVLRWAVWGGPVQGLVVEPLAWGIDRLRLAGPAFSESIVSRWAVCEGSVPELEVDWLLLRDRVEESTPQ